MIQKQIALFDIDKTIYDGYVIFPLAEFQFKKGIIDKIVLDNLYEDLRLYKSKKVDYETTVENLNRHWIEGLKNKPYQLLLQETEKFLQTKESSRFFPFAKPLMSLLTKTHDIYFVTGELQFIGKSVADYFGVNGYISSVVEVNNGLVTNKLSRSLSKKENKKEAIKHLLKRYPHNQSLAFGDSEGDMEMLNDIKNAFCINATEGLKEIAQIKGWNIVTPDNIFNEVRERLHG